MPVKKTRTHGSEAPIGRIDRREVARFTREQPVLPIPRRLGTSTAPGLIALELLGYRVIHRLSLD